MQKITIGIITFKRPQGLKKLLNSLAKQETDKSISIIVVDNDKKNEAKIITESLGEKYPIDINVFTESIRGVVAARNKVIVEFLKTDSEALIFIDDDEWPVNSNWIEKLVETQEAFAADAVCSDVNIIPETNQIDWVQNVLLRSRDKRVSLIKDFFTGNLLLMRKVLEDINPAFDERFATTGSEDLHFSIKFNHLDYKAYYTPEAPLQEIFYTSQANLKWFFLRGYRTGESSTRANIYEGKFPSVHMYILYKFFGRLIKALYTIGKSLIFLNKGYLARGLFYVGSTLGTPAGFFDLKYNEYNTVHGK